MVEKAAEAFEQAYFLYHCDQGKLQYLNQSFAQLFGLSAQAALQDPFLLLDRVHPEDQAFLREQYQKIMATGAQEGIEIRVKVPGQALKWVCVSCTRVDEGQDRYLAGFATDITKRKEYQNNILKFNSKKNSTLEILSHDLAAPFANIEGMVRLLELELTAANPAVMELVTYIKENAKKGSDLIRDFVDNEFLESSQVVLHLERVNLAQRISIMVENYQQVGGSLLTKNFVLNVPSEPVFAYIDVMKFMQVLNNLVSNAIKFTSDHGTITVALQDQGPTVLVSIADNGIGIPEDLKPFLFDKFTKARRKGVRGEKSVGLGMSIIKNIVELHQGIVWFESKEGEGSTFFVQIPKS